MSDEPRRKRVSRKDPTIDEEQAFLSQMDKEGWKLTHVTMSSYKFEECPPGTYETVFYYEPVPNTRDRTIIKARENGARIIGIHSNNNYKYFIYPAGSDKVDLKHDYELKKRAYKSQRFIQRFNLVIILIALVSIVIRLLTQLLGPAENRNTTLIILFALFVFALVMMLIRTLKMVLYYEKKYKEAENKMPDFSLDAFRKAEEESAALSGSGEEKLEEVDAEAAAEEAEIEAEDIVDAQSDGGSAAHSDDSLSAADGGDADAAVKADGGEGEKLRAEADSSEGDEAGA